MLSEKTKYFTTDNASAMVLAFSGEDWISCSAHNMNLLHKNSFKEFKTKYESNNFNNSIKVCKQLVRLFKQSNIQNELQTKLKQSIGIRWDSKYLMLESIHKNLSHIKEIAINNRKIFELLIKLDENVLLELITFLKPFYDLRQTLCKENSPTLHLVLPTKQKMISLCIANQLDSQYMKSLKLIYSNNIEKYFKVNNLHKISTILYPPLRELKCLLSIEEKHRLISKLSDLMSELQINTTIVSQSLDDYSMKVDLCLQDFIDLSQTQVNTFGSQELDDYMKTGHKFDINSSLLGYWEQNRNSYPRLYRLAIRLLSIPATNLSSERNFSAAGLTLTDHRSRLSPQNVNELLFIRSNFDLY
jgi:hypothetical protein